MAKLYEILPILGGIYCTLVGFKVISASKSKGPEYDEWHKKWGVLLKVAGPVIILTGIARLFLE